MVRNEAKCSQKPPKKRRLYTPEPVCDRVAERHVKGESKRRIAREEGIDRETVDRILMQEEVVIMRAEYYSRLLEMFPKAAQVLEKALDSDDLRVALGAATKLMEFTHLHNEDIYQTIKAANQEEMHKVISEETTEAIGAFAKRVVDHAANSDTPLPLGFEWLIEILKLAHAMGSGAVVPPRTPKTDVN